MREESSEKQVWTTPSLETLEMRATADGNNNIVEPEAGGEGRLS